MQHDVDKSAILMPGLANLRQQLQAAIATYGSDPAIRRALIHAEGAIADRLGERRSVERRSDRRGRG